MRLSFVHRGVGGITESDLNLAAVSNATVIGFNVRPDRKAREVAEREGVEIRLYEVIYGVLDDVSNALVGMLKPEYEEVVTGDAEVREVFSVPRVGRVAGCYVSTASSPAARRCASCATARSSGRARSRRCGASRTTSARSARASSAVSASRTTRTSSPATSSRPSRNARSPV